MKISERGMPEREPDRWSGAWVLTLSAFLVGFAIQLNLGRLDPGAMVLLSLAVPLAILGVLRPNWAFIHERNVKGALAITLTVQFAMLTIWPPGTAVALQDPDTLLPLRVGLIAASLLALCEVFEVRALAKFRMPVLFLFWGVAAAWVVSLSPSPPNDVWWFQQFGGDALLRGVDPYSIHMPNIYAPDVSRYAPGSVHADRLDFGYPYPPLSLLLSLPGLILLGDTRFAHIAVALGAAVLISRMQSSPLARGAALLFLFTPSGWFVIEQAWTDPQAVLAVAGVSWLAVRRRHALLGPAVGLGIALKQHVALLLPLGVLTLPRPLTSRRVAAYVGAGVITALALMLPALVWDPGGFWHSVVELQFQQPFRPDAMSFLALLGLDDPRLALIGFATLIPSGYFVARYGARTPAGFAAGSALVYLLFFAFNKQAFANYYYLVIGAMCCAIAAAQPMDVPPARHAPAD